MDNGTRTLPTRDKIGGCYRSNHCELVGNICSWLRVPIHSCKSGRMIEINLVLLSKKLDIYLCDYFDST